MPFINGGKCTYHVPNLLFSFLIYPKLKQLLHILIVLVLFGAVANAQAPNITYSSSAPTLAVGTAFTATVTNTGGAVPATTYGQVTTLAGSTTGASGLVNQPGTLARFNDMEAIVGDNAGNIYVAEYAGRQLTLLVPKPGAQSNRVFKQIVQGK